LAAARVANTAPSIFGVAGYRVASNELTLTLSRQFNHITF
jgi:hypothetical protein